MFCQARKRTVIMLKMSGAQAHRGHVWRASAPWSCLARKRTVIMLARKRTVIMLARKRTVIMLKMARATRSGEILTYSTVVFPSK